MRNPRRAKSAIGAERPGQRDCELSVRSQTSDVYARYALIRVCVRYFERVKSALKIYALRNRRDRLA